MGKIIDTIMGNTMENKWEVNGKWIWILMDEQTDFYIGNENGYVNGKWIWKTIWL